MEVSGRFRASRHDVARTGCISAYVPSPQFNFNSTRDVAGRLASRFTTVAIDWVGFGDRPRPPLKWSPDIYRSFLAYLLNEIVPRPFATIAAGHAAAYCLDAAAARPGSTGRLCLIAPTWRGPLPTMMGRKHPMFAQISRLVDWPVFGDFLYRLNVNRFMVRKMALGHVYAKSSSLSEAQFEEKLAVTRASGARHSSIRFVAGELDPMPTREAFLSAARQVNDPIMVVYGAETPLRSARKWKLWRVCPMLWLLLSPMQNWPCMRNSPTK